MIDSVQERQRTVAPNKEAKPPNGASFLLLLLIGIGIILVMNQYKGADFIERDEDGNFKISEERDEKLQQRLKEIDNAEQYVLRAARNGYYPCYNCKDSTQIFLYYDEVWKYGVTTKEQSGRYSHSYLLANGLEYLIQFKGDLAECYKEEQRKIFHYAILPENLKRKSPLIRPPGNKIDR